MRLGFAHGALDPQEQAVVVLSRIINAVFVDDQRVGQEIQCRFVFTGENDELTPDFPDYESLREAAMEAGVRSVWTRRRSRQSATPYLEPRT